LCLAIASANVSPFYTLFLISVTGLELSPLYPELDGLVLYLESHEVKPLELSLFVPNGLRP